MTEAIELKSRTFRQSRKRPRDLRMPVLDNCIGPGISYRSDRALGEMLDVGKETIRRARDWLVGQGVIEPNPMWGYGDGQSALVPRYLLKNDISGQPVTLPPTVPGDGLPGFGGGSTNKIGSGSLDVGTIPADLIPADGIITQEVELRILTWLAAFAPSDNVKRQALADLREIRQATGVGVGPPDPTNDEEQVQRLLLVLDCASPENVSEALRRLEEKRAQAAKIQEDSSPSNGPSDLEGRDL